MDALDEAVASLLLPLEELDELVLDETLVVDEELLLSDSSSSETPSPFASSQRNVDDKSLVKKKKTRPAAYNSNNARTQRRRELAYLKQRVTEMQEELARAEVKERALTKSVWRQVAHRQADERHRAETENKQLRMALETQLKVAKSLEAILYKRSTTQTIEDCGLGRHARAFNITTHRSDARVFESLLASVEAIYTDADWLVRQGKDSSNDILTSSHDARMRPTEDGLLVEIFATDLLPFNLSETSAAAWQYFSHGKNQVADPFRHYYEQVGDGTTSSKDTVLERSGLEMRGQGATIAARMTQAIRRYVEPDRVVIAWNATMEPVEFGCKPLNGGFSLREWGCMVLRPSDGESPLTVLQSCFFIKPEFHSDANSGDRPVEDTEVGNLTECVLTWTASSVAAWRQRIENILVDKHRKPSDQLSKEE